MIKKIIAGALLIPSFVVMVGFTAAANESSSSSVSSSAISSLSSSSGASSSSSLSPKRKTLDIACVKTAVEKRESAIQVAWDKFFSAKRTALETRKSELLTAWGIQDRAARRVAINAAWAKFKVANKNARRTLEKEINAIWKQFKTEHRACGAVAAEENPGLDTAL